MNYYENARLSPDEVHPVIELIQQRAAADSQRGSRDDGRTLALAIEGGGSSGTISGGMCVELEKKGLIDAVDVIYGTSTGALNGSYTAAGQASAGALNYADSISRQFINPWRMLLGRPPVNLHYLFEDIVANKRPYDVEGLSAGPDFRAIAVNLESRERVVMKDFDTTEDLRQAVWASCSLPFPGVPPILYKGKPMADGALLESVPYQSALEAGATDVLVLRSKPSSYRKTPYPKALIEVLRRKAYPGVAELLGARPELYNQAATELEELTASKSNVLQIVPTPTVVNISHLERSPEKIRQGLTAGALALEKALQA